jgi:hypothetical protein
VHPECTSALLSVKYTGIRIDPPIDWEDVTDHQNFINSEAYATLGAEAAKVVSFGTVPVMSMKVRRVEAIFYAEESTAHTNFTSDANVARQAPVTAFKSFMLPEDATREQKSALEDAFLKLAQFNMSQTTCIGYACGWSEFFFLSVDGSRG